MPQDSGFKAFVDASAGAAGALFSCVALYPLDYAKVLKQIQSKRGASPMVLLENNTKEEKDAKKQKDTAHDRRARRASDGGDKKNVSSLKVTFEDQKKEAEGVAPGLTQIILDIVRKDGPSGLFVGIGPKCLSTVASAFTYFYCYSMLKSLYAKTGAKMSSGANLLVASLAGAMNMSLTLPLEVVTTRVQVDKTLTVPGAINELRKENGLCAFWKGFLPSMVLVSNPAINYTLFDQLKLVLLRFRAQRYGARVRAKNLTAFEAFVLAALAKAIATVITYPLIRAKVLMQAERKREQSPTASSPGLAAMLARILGTEGPEGLYRGCGAQLLNTVLKSALMLMTQEKISQLIYRFMFSLRKERALAR